MTRRNRIGSNQFKTKSKEFGFQKLWYTGMFIAIVELGVLNSIFPFEALAEVNIVSPVARSAESRPEEVAKPASLAEIYTPTPTPSELEEIVAYITRVFEPEGKAVVVRAINCFYSESGLREDKVGQNSDGPKSKDHGVAQLNDYWHKLTQAEKTEYKANIDKAYKIYKGRGDNFSAWYGRLCN